MKLPVYFTGTNEKLTQQIQNDLAKTTTVEQYLTHASVVIHCPNTIAELYPNPRHSSIGNRDFECVFTNDTDIALEASKRGFHVVASTAILKVRIKYLISQKTIRPPEEGSYFKRAIRPGSKALHSFYHSDSTFFASDKKSEKTPAQADTEQLSIKIDTYKNQMC